MEDDDEFGDLYTDVLQPFTSSSSAPQPSQPHHSSPAPAPAPPSIDLNLTAPEIPYAPSHSNSPATHRSSDLMIDGRDDVAAVPPEPVVDARVPHGGNAEITPRVSLDLNRGKELASGVDAGTKGDDLMDKDVKFDIEDDDGGDIGSEPVIPGLLADATSGSGGGDGGEDLRRVEGGLEGGGADDDWDSDSDDDLQIVLNDNSHMAMERGGMVGDDDDEDEDGGLVIVADGDPNHGGEEQDWGENATLPSDGERKDAELAKSSTGVAAPLKIGYSGHGYHPFHSQYKYVRPGAAPMPGVTTSAPGGPLGLIRPLANMAGRGRGDWRPPGVKGAAAMQKGFLAGSGLPGWGNSAAGRGFGGGLEFTLPSHKTIFDVDIESFEEKPWKYPNVDVSDFFNFGLNEDSWKDYCKQLEQLRLESTMQSKIRVYECGRTEQEYDPDLPPELAAATGIHDAHVEHANSVKSDVGQTDVVKGSGRGRPPLPTGRAIQVEGGCGERLPSIDTRPPRLRDSDAIIEIVLQGAEDDDSSTGIGAQDLQDDGDGTEPPREDFREGHVVRHEIPRLEPEYFDNFPQDYNGQKKELGGRRMPFMTSSATKIPNGDENSFCPREEPNNYCSKGQNPRPYGGNFASSHEERWTQRSVSDQSPPITPVQELATDDNQKEESAESMDGRHSALVSSPVTKDAREATVEDKDIELENAGTADGRGGLEKEETGLNTVGKMDMHTDGTAKRQVLTSEVEQPLPDEVDDWEDSKAARSSDNSKARSASSRDNRKRREGFEEEVVQDSRSSRLDGIRQQPDEHEQGHYKREQDGKHEPERNRMHKGREGSHLYKERHPSSSHLLQTNTDEFDRKKDRDNFDMDWTQRDDDLYSRRVRNEDPRKRDRAKVRENERRDKDDSAHFRKQLDNGACRVPYDKDVGSRDSRHRERDDGFKIRYEGMEDHHSKRRKDEEYLRREHIDKEEVLHGHRESSSRRRREREVVLDPRKRDDLHRTRDNLEDQYATRPKDETSLLRERDDRQRDREEWHRMKQPHEEHLPKREREEGRTSIRSGRGSEAKVWAGQVRAKDEHRVSEKEPHSREGLRHGDQLKKRDRVQDESARHKGRDDAYTRGQYSSEERRSRQERSNGRSDNQRVHDRKHKEGSRKSKEPEISDPNSLGLPKRNQENQSGPASEKGLKGSGDEEHAEHEVPAHRLPRKHREDISSDDEHQDSHRGRSKLERWTSHKERDFNISSKSSLQFKEIDKNNKDGSSEARKPVDESSKAMDIDNHLLSTEGRESVDLECKDADAKQLGDRQDRHLDTVERLKKRSERFKLPMPSEKEALAIKKLESEPLPTANSENPVESEVKQERPARKRRWMSS
ncbi:hypothetical protein HN51_011676 [Arachis hypogaea]|uniref:Pre-mRNA polyadenylation factor Fip1 domain-containing protein n=1 Tax=Arachis hypogaea TaxID=3818 RepID=A0A445DY14_ARAHY|nr:FIP1[V]-like protein [Arachis hypogaea]QHO57016.1 FIP1[V]-like protein [Arachis hypogaea]RYR68088.1 hypothetical protein Ahy_A03g014555 [Arachis hypogaea]